MRKGLPSLSLIGGVSIQWCLDESQIYKYMSPVRSTRKLRDQTPFWAILTKITPVNCVHRPPRSLKYPCIIPVFPLNFRVLLARDEYRTGDGKPHQGPPCSPHDSPSPFLPEPVLHLASILDLLLCPFPLDTLLLYQ